MRFLGPPFPGSRQWPVAFSQNLPLLAAILVIEFIYAIVGIVWLTQYYTSCNDLTAKNVTLGMHPICPISEASLGAEVIGPSLQRKGLRRRSRETPKLGCTLHPVFCPPTWVLTRGAAADTELPKQH